MFELVSQELQLDTDKSLMRQGFGFAAAIIFVFSSGLQAVPAPCLEPKLQQEKMFFPSKLSEAKADARDSEFLPIHHAIEQFIKSHAHWKFSQIHIISSSAHTPVTKPTRLSEAEIVHVNKLNKKSNHELALTRLGFAKFALSKIKNVEILYSAEVLGPNFTYHSDPRQHDQNLKMVIPEFSQNYGPRVAEIFAAHKNDFAKVGITSVEELHDKSLFKSLYDVKFKAFQGYTVFLRGKISCQLKMLPELKPDSTSKQ